MQNSEAPVITVDGPSGSGKGTIASLLADELGWHLLDSGALYRLVALCAGKHNVDLVDEAALQELAESMDVQFESQLNAQGVSQQAAVAKAGAHPIAVMLEGTDVSAAIRAEDVGKQASKVAALGGVRQGLLMRQRAFRTMPGLVADGRDMGTVVFPDAALKFFLTASVESRAQRRMKQLEATKQLSDQGISVSLDRLREDIRARDDRDMNRSIAPLKPAETAIVIDSTSLGIAEVLALVMEHVRKQI